jgi:hypothetical protein
MNLKEDAVRKMGARKSGMLGWYRFRGLAEKSIRHH